MFHHATTLRITTAMAIGGLVLGPIQPARAQAAPAPATVDPPARVGRIADLSGTVSFHTADETQWSAATLNYPVTGGDSVWTEPKSSAVLDLGGGRMTLDQASQVDIDTLDTQTVTATEKQGDVYLRVRSVVPGETYTVVTPRGSVVITEPGRYGIVAGDTDTPTSVTVVEGAAHVTGTNLDLPVQAHQTASITGTDSFAGTVGPATDDPFLAAQLSAERPRVAQRTPAAPRPVAQAPAPEQAPEQEVAQYEPPPVVQQMTGAEELQDTGTWTEVPQYGRVWYPPVEQGYVPYRHGHWAFVAPWGWTWIDAAPWGFAPFHYGRWVEVRDRWGWTPVAEGCDYAQPPVYAPALVSFIDPAAVLGGVAVGLAVGLAFDGHHHDRHGRGYDGDVGWVPLGYSEPYYPPYRASRQYVSRINGPDITHVEITRVTNNYITNNYYGAPAVAGRPAVRPPTFVNAAAATAVPRLVMANSNPIAPVARPLTPQQLVAARPAPQMPLAPTARTIGVTPVVARRFQIPPAQLATQQDVRTTPGPVVMPRTFPPAQPHPSIGAAAIGAGLVGAGAIGAAALAARPPLPPVGGLRAQAPRPGAAPLPTQPSIPQAVAAPGRPTPARPNAAGAPIPSGPPPSPKAAPRTPVPGLPVAPGLPNVARPPVAPSTARPDVPAPPSPHAPTLGAPVVAAPHPAPPTVPRLGALSTPPPAPMLAKPRPAPPPQPAVPHSAPPVPQAAPRPAPSVQPVAPRLPPPVQPIAPRPAPPVQPVMPHFTPPAPQPAPHPAPFVQPAAPRFTPPVQQAPPPPVRYSPPPPPQPRFTPPPPPPQPRFTPPPPQPHSAPPPPPPQRRVCPPGHPVC